MVAELPRGSPSWDDLAVDYDSLFENIEDLKDLEFMTVRALLAPFSAHRVLDCAAGTGMQVLRLARAGYDVTAADISPRALAVLSELARSEGVQVSIHVADFRNLAPFADASFEATLCMGNSLPLLDDRGDVIDALRAMRRVTQPGGPIVVGLHSYAVAEARGEAILFRRAFNETDIAFDHRDFGRERVDVTYVTLRSQRVRGVTKSYLRIEPPEMAQLMEKAGVRDVRALDETGLAPYAANEWAIVAGRV